eukprot:gene18720-6130_t
MQTEYEKEVTSLRTRLSQVEQESELRNKQAQKVQQEHCQLRAGMDTMEQHVSRLTYALKAERAQRIQQLQESPAQLIEQAEAVDRDRVLSTEEIGWNRITMSISLKLSQMVMAHSREKVVLLEDKLSEMRQRHSELDSE